MTLSLLKNFANILLIILEVRILVRLNMPSFTITLNIEYNLSDYNTPSAILISEIRHHEGFRLSLYPKYKI